MNEQESNMFAKEMEELKKNIRIKDEEISKLKSDIKEQDSMLKNIEALENKIKEYEEDKVKNKKVENTESHLKEIESYKEKLMNNQKENEKTINQYRELIKSEMIKNTISRYDIKETTKDLLMQKLSQDTLLDENNKIFIKNDNGLPKSNELGSQLTLEDYINDIKKVDIDTSSFAFFKEAKQISGEQDMPVGGPPDNGVAFFRREDIPNI